MFLTEQEVRDLTDRSQAPAQIKRLVAMKIPYRYVPGGRVKVLASEIQRTPKAQTEEPDFSVFS